MFDTMRLPVSTFVLVATLLLGMVVSYQAAVRGITATTIFQASAQETPAPVTLVTDRYLIGVITAPTADEEQHFVRMVVELKYQGDIGYLIKERQYEIQEKISQMITGQTYSRTKEDFADGFLQVDFAKALNVVIDRAESAARITKVTIAGFLAQ